MALIQCEECGKEISNKASACIHCGCPINADVQIAEKALKETAVVDVSINGVNVNLHEIVATYGDNKMKAVKHLIDLTGVGVLDANNIIDKAYAENAPSPVATGAKEIDSVVIVGGHSETKAGSAIGRGAVGAALLGPVGLLAAASAKKKDMVFLLLRYKDGTTETVQTKVGSALWKLYAPHIKG